MLAPITLLDEVRADMTAFINAFEVTESELKSLRIKGVTGEQVKQVLKETYGI